MKWSGLGESNPSCWLGRPLRAITKSALPAILLLSGCASTMPETVMVPIPVPCIDEMPHKPALYTDGDLLKLPDTDFIIALGIDRQARMKYIGELESVLQACVK